MIEKELHEVTEFPITDANNEDVYIGKKRLMGIHANRWNMLTLKLEGGGELPDALKDQKFTNYKACREVVGNYLRNKELEEEATRSYHKSRKPAPAEVKEDDSAEKEGNS